jgi:putative transcriptional regulator
VKLREAMEGYRRRTGERMTYQLLAKRTGLAKSTIESIATRSSYNASLRTIDKICGVLGCSPGELLELNQKSTREQKKNIT